MFNTRIIFCFLMLCSCETATESSKQIKFYSEGSEFRQVAQAPPLGSRQRKSFDRVKTLGNVHMRFFGAFAASSGDGEVWWVGNYHSLESANRKALKNVVRCRNEPALLLVISSPLGSFQLMRGRPVKTLAKRGFDTKVNRDLRQLR